MRNFFLLIAVMLLLIVAPSYGTVYAARIHMMGAELATTTNGFEWVSMTAGSVMSATSTAARSGTYSWRVNPTSTFAIVIQTVQLATTYTATSTVGMAIKVVTRPSASTTILRHTLTNATSSYIALNTSGTLSLYNASGTIVGSESSIIATSTANSTSTSDWHCVELQTNATTTPGELSARLDGSTFASGTSPGKTQVNRFSFGSITAGVSTDFFIDDIYSNNDVGSSQTGFTGCGHMIALRPNDPGDVNSWARGGSDSGANWSQLDEITPNDITDYISSSTLNVTSSDYYNIDNTSAIGNAGTVNVVSVGGRFRNDIADNAAKFSFLLRKASGGTVASSSLITPNSTTWRSYNSSGANQLPLVLYNDPDGNPWSQNTVNTIQIGQGWDQYYLGTRDIQITSLWAYIDYDPLTIAVPPPKSGVVFGKNSKFTVKKGTKVQIKGR